MTRQRTDYTSRQPQGRTYRQGADVTTPQAGYFRMKLRSGGVAGGVRIWFGAPLDPIDGTVLDRSHRFQAEFNGEPIPIDDVWPQCTGEPISEADYRAFCNRQAWAKQAAPDSAYADPRKRHDPLSLSSPLPF